MKERPATLTALHELANAVQCLHDALVKANGTIYAQPQMVEARAYLGRCEKAIEQLHAELKEKP